LFEERPVTTTEHTELSLAEDLCDGAFDIGQYIGKSERQALHLCATRQIPAFKEGGKWRMRKSRYAKHVEALEEASLNASPRAREAQRQAATVKENSPASPCPRGA
jgi:hypothetical protein